MMGVLELVVREARSERVKVLVGGAPVTEAYARQIGGDAYSPNAAHAVSVAKALIGKS